MSVLALLLCLCLPLREFGPLFTRSIDIYGVLLRAGCASRSGDTGEEKAPLPLRTPIPAPCGVRALPPTPRLHAGRLSLTSCSRRLITLLSKLESKTNTGQPELLGPGFCSPGQEAGQQAASPLCPLPRGAPSGPGEMPRRVLFGSVAAVGSHAGSRNSQPFPLTLFYGALLTLLWK